MKPVKGVKDCIGLEELIDERKTDRSWDALHPSTLSSNCCKPTKLKSERASQIILLRILARGNSWLERRIS